jgi:hypothetical protein
MIDTGPLQALPTSAEDPQQVTAEIPGSGPASIARRKTAPMSIFVSRKSNKLFVRHGLQPLLEAPVTIQDPEAALGTHVFTLMASRDEGAASRWTVVSIPNGPPRAAQGSTRRHKSAAKHVVETAPLDSSPEKAHAALSRIEMPPDVVERLAELLTPGSSLIVSDHGVSKETGHDTDFIVETR